MVCKTSFLGYVSICQISKTYLKRQNKNVKTLQWKQDFVSNRPKGGHDVFGMDLIEKHKNSII